MPGQKSFIENGRPCFYMDKYGTSIAQSMLSVMAAGDASQATPVQIMHIFLCGIVVHKLGM